MFQAETEDMLPRMAIKPSDSLASGAALQLEVPEVTILFGQQDANAQQPNSQMHIQEQFKNNTQQTYAAWKKQMLPKVTYPAAAVTQDTYLTENAISNNNVRDYNMPKTNLYPMRTTNTPAPLTMQIGGQSNGFISRGEVNNPLSYRRSLESCNNKNVYQQLPYQQQSPRQILPIELTAQASNKSTRDALTICAGTQTEATLGSPNMLQGLTDISKLASKQDLEDVLQIVQDMRHEQTRIIKMLESFIFSPQMATKPETKDMSMQVDFKEMDKLPNGNDDCIGHQAVVTNKFIQHLKPSANILQTPKTKPIAQSTTYRPSSPQIQRAQDVAPTTYQQPLNAPPSLTKSSSDTSIVMNELALKYLPNEKLVELLNELNMDCPQSPTTQNHLPNPSLPVTNNPTTPYRVNKENFERSPSDISNASYKYLKKYRLLPEDYENGHDGNIKENQQNIPQYNTPQRQQEQQQYDVRNSPINHRQTPPGLAPAKCSPYAGRLPLSPLARATTLSTPQHIVDLENIKYQPKFL